VSSGLLALTHDPAAPQATTMIGWPELLMKLMVYGPLEPMTELEPVWPPAAVNLEISSVAPDAADVDEPVEALFAMVGVDAATSWLATVGAEAATVVVGLGTAFWSTTASFRGLGSAVSASLRFQSGGISSYKADLGR
jgi:hypothetical protein